jgi:hypothetical protein
MSLIEVLKAESLKNAGKPLLLDNIRVLANVNRESFDVVLSELVQLGACVLSMVDGQVMIQYIPSVDEPAVNEVLMKSATRRGSIGRPKVDVRHKRVRLSFARIPSWLVKWLQDRKQVGRQIEEALVEHYHLSPPC